MVSQGRGTWSHDVVLGCSPALNEIRRPRGQGEVGERNGTARSGKASCPVRYWFPRLFVLATRAARRNRGCKALTTTRPFAYVVW